MQGLLFNENYELEVKSDLPVPKPGKNQALIKILAVSLNRRDFWITQGLYPNLKVIYYQKKKLHDWAPCKGLFMLHKN